MNTNFGKSGRSLSDQRTKKLKVRKNRNDFMKTSFLPKTNEIILRISALLYILLTFNKTLSKLAFKLFYKRNSLLCKGNLNDSSHI